MIFYTYQDPTSRNVFFSLHPLNRINGSEMFIWMRRNAIGVYLSRLSRYLKFNLDLILLE